MKVVEAWSKGFLNQKLYINVLNFRFEAHSTCLLGYNIEKMYNNIQLNLNLYNK